MTQIINPTIFAATGPPTLLGGEIGMWIPSLDDAGNGTTTMYDLFGSTDATLSNFPTPPTIPPNASGWVTDTTAGGARAIDFDGTNDYIVDLTADTALQRGVSDPWTIAAWLYIRTASGVPAGVFGVSAVAGNYGLVWGTTGASMAVDYNDGAKLWRVRTTSGISRNVWVHTVYTHGGGGSGDVKMYVNGVSVPVTIVMDTGPASITWTSTILYFSDRNSPYTYRFNGRFDDGRIYNRALTAAEVATLYNSGTGRGI